MFGSIDELLLDLRDLYALVGFVDTNNIISLEKYFSYIDN